MPAYLDLADLNAPGEASYRLKAGIAAVSRIIAIANQKGGVGKTTTSVNLATALAAAKHNTLLIDFDPQGNATTGFGIGRRERSVGSYDLVIGGVAIGETIRSAGVPHLDIITAERDLAGAELELVDAKGREFRLRDALAGLATNYAFIIIDCPPSLGLLTLNALVAADRVLVPLQCEFYALEGLSALVHTIERVRQAFNPRLAIEGVVLTMFDRRNNLSAMIENDVRAHFGEKVYRTVIPRNVRVSEAPSHGKPVLLYDLRSPGAQAYVQLASELLRRQKETAP